MKTQNLQRVVFVFAFAKAIILTSACQQKTSNVERVEYEQTTIDKSIAPDENIKGFIKPYKERIDAQMDSVLSFNLRDMSKTDTPLNTAIGNMMAEIVRVQGEKVFQERTGKSVDIVLLNHGGIRAPLPKGDVSTRNAYEIMPFENEMVVVELSGEKIWELVDYIVQSKRAHPFDGLRIALLPDDSLDQFSINGSSLDMDATYHVLTSDYLQNGGDNMTFLTEPIQLHKLDYKIRNAMIDFFERVDTLDFTADNRYIQK